MEATERTTLIKNVRIYDGTSKKLRAGKDVVLSGNKIDKLTKTGGKEEKYETVIDGGGATLMPGLSEVHAHLALCRPPQELENLRTWDYIGAITASQSASPGDLEQASS